MKMIKNISLLGAGSMGTAISILLAENGHNVLMWTPYKEEADMINSCREQKDKLPGIKVHDNVSCTVDLEEATCFSDILVLAVPSQNVRETSKKIAPAFKGKKTLVSFSKGLEIDTGFRISEILRQEIPDADIVAMSGPCHAEELACGLPTLYVAASDKKSSAEMIQDIFMSTSRFSVYVTPDVAGVELGGAAKNVIALCAGISDGLGMGDNTKAALMTRGIAEISRLGKAIGARAQTFAGLAGIGDLIVTCTSMHSRNRRAGILIGQGKTPEEAIKEVKMVVEGFYTAKPLQMLSRKYNIEMPIIAESNEVLFNNKDPKKAVLDLMSRDKKLEPEDDFCADKW
jgi:glycerol-3-phosphate dehydrogenase (NAD(P)+)